MRYYFTVKDSRTYRDETGYIFNDPEEAIRYAQTIAAELAKEPDLQDSHLIITDEQGNHIGTIAIPP